MESVTHPWEAVVHGLSLPVLIWRCVPSDTPVLELTYANPVGAGTFRLAAEAGAGQRFYDVMPDLSIIRRLEDLHEAVVETFHTGETRHVRGVSIHFADAPLHCLHFNCVALPTREVALVGESPYKGYLDNSSDIFGVLSPAGDMLYVTPSAATNFGFAPDDFGEVIEGLTIDEPGMTALIDAWYYVMSNPNAMQTIEYRRQDRDGNWHDMELIVRDYLENPAVGGVLFNSRDISQRKADERKIRALNADLEAFTYTVSHDLRLPLRLVSEVLSRIRAGQESTLAERDRVDIDRAADLVADMTALIRDLLAFSRSGSTALDCAPVDLSALAREVCDELVLSGGVAREAFTIQEGLEA